MLSETSVLNYSTKRGYRIALKQNTQPMNVDLELEREGYNSKARAKFFNRIWHPYLPRKVSAMQWLILTEGLPDGAWRERIGLSSDCELCPNPVKETLQHALQDCPQLSRAWELFRNTRKAAKLPPSYHSWADISRGLMRDPPGPHVEEDLRWDTASAFSLNANTPWDILRAQLLWSIWCQKVVHTFRDEEFHLGVVLWHAWRNTIYCAMEAYKEIFRHKKNEEKWQELLHAFNRFGQRRACLVVFKVSASDGMQLLLKNSCQKNLEHGLFHLFELTGSLRRLTLKRILWPCQTFQTSLMNSFAVQAETSNPRMRRHQRWTLCRSLHHVDTFLNLQMKCNHNKKIR